MLAKVSGDILSLELMNLFHAGGKELKRPNNSK